MTVMCRFIIDKMPLIFSTPRYFGHIPLLAVPGRTRSWTFLYVQGRNDGTSLGYDAFLECPQNSTYRKDVLHQGIAS